MAARHTRLPFTLLIVLLLTASCGPRELKPGSDRDAWDRQDLWVNKPEVEIAPEAAGHRKVVEREIAYLGASEVRDVEHIHPSHLKVVKQLPASEVRALRQMAGSRLRWTLSLGREPYLSFIPLRNETDSEPCVYQVTVRTGSGQQQLHSAPAEHTVPPGQATVIVDLKAYAGQTVDLLFEVQPPPGAEAASTDAGGERQAPPRALWGSPAVYSHRQPARQAATVQQPNVLLIGADTLRADALGAYGAQPSVTPGLDRLASESDLWTTAVSAFNVTNPSFISLMTGLYGKDHGIYDLVTKLPEEQTTLAEHFAAAGYHTFAVIAAHHLGPQASGLGQGFEEIALAGRHYTAELGADMTMDWIAEHQDQPFFIWLHLFDPHTPHTPPEPFALGYYPTSANGLSPVAGWSTYRQPGWLPYLNQVLGANKDLYPGEVAYLDHQVDRLLDFLRSRGLLETTVIAFVADHGENLEDHGIRYAHTGLFETTTHVPLMIRWPDALQKGPRGRRLDGLVQSLDLFPTLLNAAGLPVPETDAIDLREQTTDSRHGRRAAFSEHAHRQGARVRTEDHAYMLSYTNKQLADGAYLFDLRKDPHEEHNLAGQGLPVEKELHELLQRWLAHHRQGTQPLPAEVSPEDLEKMRSLGYL